MAGCGPGRDVAHAAASVINTSTEERSDIAIRSIRGSHPNRRAPSPSIEIDGEERDGTPYRRAVRFNRVDRMLVISWYFPLTARPYWERL